MPLLHGSFEIYGEDSFRSQSSSGIGSDPSVFAVDSRNIVNLHASYINNKHHPHMSLFANNLFGEDYITARARDFFGAGVIKRGDPQSVGMQARYDF